jgi:predicted ribosome quality control (RQC) complex YloA/Tae2 family protein
LGHLLLAHAGLWQPGLTSLTVEDAYREGQPVALALDPALNVQENAERYYAKHREQQARRTAAQQQLAQAEQELAALEPAVADWPGVTNWKQLQAFLERFPQLQARQGAGVLKAEEPLPYRETVFQGYRIRVGRNAKTNDLLTLRHSRKADWWLHARDGNGAHVVVVARHATEAPPRPVLEYAAGLAAGNSQAQHSALVPVVYTQVKYLRKRKGFAPGKVLYDRAETLLVEPRKG